MLFKNCNMAIIRKLYKAGLKDFKTFENFSQDLRQNIK